MIFTKAKLNKGMTYVELIVVMSIFSTLAAVVMFNYSAFQSKIDIKNLANDIALRLVQAQRSANAGLVPLRDLSSYPNWKPSYGIFIEKANNKTIKYFTNLDNSDQVFDGSSCSGSGECLELIDITKGNSISRIDAYNSSNEVIAAELTNLTILFTRPSEEAKITTTPSVTNFYYMQITVTSPKLITATIKIFPSGRIEVN